MSLVDRTAYNMIAVNFEPQHLAFDEPLKNHTTFGIGGPADLLITVSSRNKLLCAVQKARQLKIPLLILGGGSNVLISDTGFRGAVILNRTSNIVINPPKDEQGDKSISTFIARALSLRGLDHNEYPVLVVADTGVPLQRLIKQSLRHNLLGLEYFAGIPGTVGGALYNNAHFTGHEIGERILAVEYLDSQSQLQIAPPQTLHFKYDYTDFRKHQDWVATRVVFALRSGDGKSGLRAYRQLSSHRQNYGGRSAGCVFANLSTYQQRKVHLPSPSIGFINDKILGLRGLQIGGAVLGKWHGNFITNENHASYEDVMAIIKMVQQEYKRRLGLRIRLEIRIMR